MADDPARQTTPDDTALMFRWRPALVGVALFGLAVWIEPDLLWLFAIGLGAFLVFLWQETQELQNKPGRTRRTKFDGNKDRTSRNEFCEAMQHPVLILLGDGKIDYMNAAARKVFGSIPVGESIFVRFRQPELRRTIQRVLSSGIAEKLEYNEPVPDDRWFNTEIAPVPSKKRKLFALSFLDFSEVKRIDRMRSDFIANASHELRTPLTSLIGYIETLNGPAKSDPKASKRFLGVMHEQAERMKRLVNDLLSLSSIEMKANVRPSETVDLTEILETVIASLSGLAQQLEVELELDGGSQAYPVLGDKSELMQVFENLIENGCKYGQEGGRVEVSIKPEGDRQADPLGVNVTVKDFGPGIAEEYQSRITERFYRVDVARSREKQGTGLGLAIVKHILQRHGTKLQLHSSPGEGTEFSVRFVLNR
jgi:two-component system phosphate regulon sensor histidine kinase PhoR